MQVAYCRPRLGFTALTSFGPYPVEACKPPPCLICKIFFKFLHQKILIPKRKKEIKNFLVYISLLKNGPSFIQKMSFFVLMRDYGACSGGK